MGISTHLCACDLNIDYRVERVDVRPEPIFGLQVKLGPPTAFCLSFYHSLLVRRGHGSMITCERSWIQKEEMTETRLHDSLLLQQRNSGLVGIHKAY